MRLLIRETRIHTINEYNINDTIVIAKHDMSYHDRNDNSAITYLIWLMFYCKVIIYFLLHLVDVLPAPATIIALF